MSGAGIPHTMAAGAFLAGVVLPCLFCIDWYLDRDYLIYHRIKGVGVLKYWFVKRKFSVSGLLLLSALLCFVRPS